MIFTLDNDLAEQKRQARSNLVKAIIIMVVVVAVGFTIIYRDAKMDQLNERMLVRYQELVGLSPNNEWYRERVEHYTILVNGE